MLVKIYDFDFKLTSYDGVNLFTYNCTPDLIIIFKNIRKMKKNNNDKLSRKWT